MDVTSEIKFYMQEELAGLANYASHVQSPPSTDVCATCKDIAAEIIKELQHLSPNIDMVYYV